MTRQTPFIIETMGMINMTTRDQYRCYVQVEINSFSWWFNNKLFYTRKYIRFFFSADRKYFLNREIFMTKQRNIYDAQKEIVYHRHHRWNSNRTRENSSRMHTARFETVRVSVSVAVTRCYSWEWVSPSDIFLTNGFCMWKQGGGASDPAPQTPPTPPSRVLCTVLVIISWAGLASLIEFHSIYNYYHKILFDNLLS